MQLNQKALLTDKHVQWIERFHLIELVFADIAFAKGMHPKVHKGSSQRRSTEQTTLGFHVADPFPPVGKAPYFANLVGNYSGVQAEG